MCGEDVEESPSGLEMVFSTVEGAAPAPPVADEALACAAAVDSFLRADSRRCLNSSIPTIESSSAISALTTEDMLTS